MTNKMSHFDKPEILSGRELKHFTRRQILDSSKLKEFADDNFKFDENGRKLSKRSNFSFFPSVFSIGLFLRGVKRCHCLGMG